MAVVRRAAPLAVFVVHVAVADLGEVVCGSVVDGADGVAAHECRVVHGSWAVVCAVAACRQVC